MLDGPKGGGGNLANETGVRSRAPELMIIAIDLSGRRRKTEIEGERAR